ncbi:MAG: hypothetical protein ACJA13_000650 [Paraglaciecola sp.]|jgi:hypothetical protein
MRFKVIDTPALFLYLRLWQSTEVTSYITTQENIMNITKILALALIVLGGVLIFFGFNQTTSPLGEMSEALTGSYTDETMQYLIGGAVAAVVGLFLMYKR